MKWISNGFDDVFKKIGDSNKFELTHEKYSETYYLIHGFMSSLMDLMPHAQYLHSKGYRVVMVVLDGHKGEESFEKAVKEKRFSVGAFYQTAQSVISTEWEPKQKNHLIGFSIGGLLALNLSQQFSFDSVTCISAFVGLKAGSIQERLTTFFTRLKFSKVKRILQVSKKSVKKQLAYFDRLSVEETKRLQVDVKAFIHDIGFIEGNILFFHSFDDLVSNYHVLVNLCKQKMTKFEIITFRELPHYLQFDIPTHHLVDYIQAYFGTQDVDVSTCNDVLESSVLNTVNMLYSENNKEVSQHMSHSFSLILGFFSILGALLYFTLPIITKKEFLPDGTFYYDVSSPYYILSYSLIINIYITIASAYVYYMNRAIAYSRNHIEPYFKMIGIQEYRQDAHISGKESTTTTKLFSSITTILPMTIGVGATLYNLIYYSNRFFVLDADNVLLQLGMLTNIFLFIFAVYGLIRLLKHANREIYGVYVNRQKNPERDMVMSRLFDSIEKGCVVKGTGE